MEIRNRSEIDDSLSLGGKVRYSPIEAAIRWCGLIEFENEILNSLRSRLIPEISEFPQWPKLRYFADRILDAIAHEELPHSKYRTVDESARFGPDDSELTIRHVDLKDWMSRYYPGERPSFLFDEVERSIHPAITTDAIAVLMADREAAKLRVAELVQLNEDLFARHEALTSEHAKLASDSKKSQVPGQRSESTYLNIIGGLLTLMLGKSPSGTPYSSFLSQEAIISAMVVHHRGAMGITDRTLQAKFALARRHLQSTMP